MHALAAAVQPLLLPRLLPAPPQQQQPLPAPNPRPLPPPSLRLLLLPLPQLLLLALGQLAVVFQLGQALLPMLVAAPSLTMVTSGLPSGGPKPKLLHLLAASGLMEVLAPPHLSASVSSMLTVVSSSS